VNYLEIFIPAAGLQAERQRLGKNLIILGKDLIGFILGGTLLAVTIMLIFTALIEKLLYNPLCPSSKEPAAKNLLNSH
jgi:hypothetical protein